MRHPAVVTLVIGITASAFLVPARQASAQSRPVALAVSNTSNAELRIWDQQIDQMIRTRELRVREEQNDPLLASRQHQRLDQYYHGLRIVGGDITRQQAPAGTVSMFGMLHTNIDIDATPKLSIDDARQAIAVAVTGESRGPDPELVVLPLSDGYHLAYFGRVATDLEPLNIFVDANTGTVLQKYSEFVHEVGVGVGAYGDKKKISSTSSSGMFIADDKLRPAEITTYDMRGNLARAQALLFGNLTPALADIASTSDNNNWTDSTVVDAHVYAGWYYDYLFKRFGRHGLDSRDLRIALFTHPVRLADIGSASSAVLGTYYINAEYCPTCGPGGHGAAILGEGAPAGFAGAGIQIKPFSASFDVMAHELTHGVTAATARLNGFPLSEAGALNEAFSDVFGVSTAFFYEPAGSAPLQASYVQGKDLTAPPAAFLSRFGLYLARSLANPAQTNNPDHYTFRYVGSEPHYTSTIMSHAFYLAIEGGTNLTSGLSVQGVGASNRDQIEKVFFRALTSLLPSSATFALTRDATIQSARDLYGAGSTAERAVTQAWNAVGVQDRVAPTAAAAVLGAGTAQICPGLQQPTWIVGVTVSAGNSNLVVSQGQLTFSDGVGQPLGNNLLASGNFASGFDYCGPGSARIQAQNDACALYCIGLAGRPSGGLQLSFTATDDGGRTQSFSTGRVPLVPLQ